MPKRSVFGIGATPWQIFDSYQQDFALQMRETEKEKKSKLLVRPKSNVVKPNSAANLSQIYLRKCKMLERMVYQNIFEEISHGELESCKVNLCLILLLRLSLLGRSIGRL